MGESLGLKQGPVFNALDWNFYEISYGVFFEVAA